MYIDLHTHGLAGNDSRSLEPETYLKMAEAFAEYGTGASLPTLFPGPVKDMRAQMGAIRNALEMQGNISPSHNHPPLNPLPSREGKLNVSPSPSTGKNNVSPSPLRGEGGGGGGSAIILGVHIEGPFVNPNKCGALDKGSFLPATLDNLARLIDGFEDIIKIMTIAPELPGALKIIEALTAKGIKVNMGHSDATFAEAKAGRLAGATGVTHLFNAMSPLHHREPGLAGYALTDDGLYVEVIADFAHVHPEMLRLVLKCKPPERVILVSDSLSAAKTKAAPDKAPLYLTDGRTLAGSGITLADAVENMVSLGVPVATAQSFATANPHRYLYG